MTSIPVGTLSSNDLNIPLIGFGTAAFPFASEDAKLPVLNAIELGYRHFDTAAIYQSEESLGEAITEALRRGLIKSREELFVTSKLWSSDAHRGRVLPALQNSLKKLGLEYLDLYLIHMPVSLKEAGDSEIPFKKETLVLMDFKSIWEAMEECRKLGLTRVIGVSNFTCKKLSDLLSVAKVPPAVNQVEMNPCWQQKKLRDYCKSKRIHVSAYSPLGATGTLWGHNHVMESGVLKEIAEARGKTIAQVALRWVYEQGVSVIVKSFNKERMKENLGIFDWELSPEDLQKICEIPQRRRSLALQFVSESGPYKTVDELWDGEL